MNAISSPTLEAESLAALIREQSAAEAGAVVEQAHEHTARMRATGAEQIAHIEGAAREEGRARGRREAAQLLAGAEAECQRRYLQARERLIEQTIARARERLAALASHPNAAAVLDRLIVEAVRALPPGPVRVLMPGSYAGLLGAKQVQRLGGERIQIQTQEEFPPGGGVVLETPDGRLRFDNSFEGRIRRMHDGIRRAAATALGIGQSAGTTQPIEGP